MRMGACENSAKNDFWLLAIYQQKDETRAEQNAERFPLYFEAFCGQKLRRKNWFLAFRYLEPQNLNKGRKKERPLLYVQVFCDEKL